MYPPKVHQEADYTNALLTVKQFPLATLITPGEKPLITHLPMTYHKDKNHTEKLLAHMDKYNPQCAVLNGTAEAIFHGPDVYISPSIYTSSQLPSWNYIKVHFRGQLNVISKEATKQSLIDMTNNLERERADKWILEEDDPRMERLLDYIVGFEFIIESWEGKYKLSQDKIDADISKAKDALSSATAPIYKTYLDQIYRNHKNVHKD